MLIAGLTIKAGGKNNGIGTVVVLYMFQVCPFARSKASRLKPNTTFFYQPGIFHLGLDVQHVGLPQRNPTHPNPTDRLCPFRRLAMAHHLLGRRNHARRNPKHRLETLHCVLHTKLGYHYRGVVLVP